jgi:hypothetical protein
MSTQTEDIDDCQIPELNVALSEEIVNSEIESVCREMISNNKNYSEMSSTCVSTVEDRIQAIVSTDARYAPNLFQFLNTSMHSRDVKLFIRKYSIVQSKIR